MSGIATIQFTQEQARGLTGVSVETIRHWRKAVPYLGTKPGKSARFSFADLLGLAVTHELISNFGVRITSISEGIDRLFRVLSDARPASFEGAVAVVTTSGASLVPAVELPERGLSEPVLAIGLDPLIARLRRQMMPVIAAFEQTTLPFPPRVVRRRGA